MYVWYHLSTIFKQRRVLQIVGLLTLCVALITTLFLNVAAHAAPGVNQTISFQGRLLNAQGEVVPEGYYNIQFKIYSGGNGTQPTDPNRTHQWTETYTNNGTEKGVYIKNGYLSVNLGSKTPFGELVDWNSDTLWLSMNIAGAAAGCSSFGTAPCADDGEMLPMKRITSTPMALNSGMVGGKTVNQLTQLGQGMQNDNSANSSIAINKTGSGNLMQLQNMATDVFTIAGTGDVLFGNNANHTIGVASSPVDTAGIALTLTAGAGGSGNGAAGGALILQGGDAGGDNGDGGSISLDAGTNTGTGAAGTIAIGSNNAGSISIGSTSVATNQTITIGAANTEGGSSTVIIGSGGAADEGSTTVQAKDEVAIKTNGETRITIGGDENVAYFGNGKTSESPNNFTIQGTGSSTTAVNGGSLALKGGDATVGNANGGNITLSGGEGSGDGATGLVIINTPTLSTVSNDENCFTNGSAVSESCTISQSSVDKAATVIVGFDAAGQTATLPDPTNITAGRLFYVIAAEGSETFTLAVNGGGEGNTTTLKQKTAATLMWNGNDWITTGASSAATLQGTNDAEEITKNVQIGSGTDDGDLSLLTLDKADHAPEFTNGEAMLGSMYYDTTLGAVQCYEETGWGACSASPDTFIALSPEYTNAVTNGSENGQLTTDICSDELNINDGSVQDQLDVCGEKETYNFYHWTSDETTEQTKSIYVTYQLPDTFKEFVEDSISLMARTDSEDASVSYQLYRKNEADGLTACGSSVDASSNPIGTWNKAVFGGLNSTSSCNFEAGDSIVIKIDLTAANEASAYISNLNFAFGNKQ